MLRRTVVSLLFFAAAGAAQPLGAGLKIGVLATDAFKVLPAPTLAVFTAESPRYTVGPYVELRLPARMAIEVDALYRSYLFRSGGSCASASYWDFPVLRRFGFPVAVVKT